jgi:hypothetical protein
MIANIPSDFSQMIEGMASTSTDDYEKNMRINVALKLRVPMSGDMEIDAMILESRRLDYVDFIKDLNANLEIKKEDKS